MKDAEASIVYIYIYGLCFINFISYVFSPFSYAECPLFQVEKFKGITG